MTMRTSRPTRLPWRIVVHGYHEPGSTGELHTSDWLDATLYMNTSDGRSVRTMEFLLVEELERIVAWLEQVRDRLPVRDLEMIDPDISFKLITRNRIPFVKLIVGSDPKRWLITDMATDPRQMEDCIGMVKEQIARYPCRCGWPHEVSMTEEDWPDEHRQRTTPRTQ